ncbi:MAG: gliding motility-associated C-terminal domain-containing protein [Saprospiraceae bacterium]
MAESCPNAKLTIPEKNISICLSPSSTPIPLLFSISDNIPNESPTVLWSSSNTKANNAINNNAVPPIFDPLIAGVGEYFVKLSYQQKSCVWEDSIRISIKAKPVITSIVSLDSICISDTLFVNTSSNPLPQIWSSSGTILTGQSSAICKIKFSNPGMNNVQLSYSNGTCTSDTITKSIFVAPEQKTPEIKCETIGNTILFTWQDTECTKSYEVWREGEIIQSSTQNKYLASSLKKGEPIEISLITNTNCPCPIPSTTKSCTLDENEDCDITLTDDHYAVTIYQPKTFDILLNDFIPYDSFTVNILEYDDDFVKDLEFKEGLEATAYKPFFDTLTVIYEVCTPDCSECKQAKLYITNEALKDIILTNIILPNSSGNNATLRFTKDDILEDSELYIFNRNGDRIFQMKNYDNSWNADGYPGGIYFYILRYHGVDIKKTLTVMK